MAALVAAIDAAQDALEALEADDDMRTRLMEILKQATSAVQHERIGRGAKPAMGDGRADSEAAAVEIQQQIALGSGRDHAADAEVRSLQMRASGATQRAHARDRQGVERFSECRLMRDIGEERFLDIAGEAVE